MTNDPNFSELEIQIAAQQEENARLQGQVQYLSQRVVVLRALINRFEGSTRLDDEETEKTNEDVAG